MDPHCFCGGLNLRAHDCGDSNEEMRYYEHVHELAPAAEIPLAVDKRSNSEGVV